MKSKVSNNKYLRRLAAMMLALCLCVTLLPVSAYAGDLDGVPENASSDVTADIADQNGTDSEDPAIANDAEASDPELMNADEIMSGDDVMNDSEDVDLMSGDAEAAAKDASAAGEGDTVSGDQEEDRTSEEPAEVPEPKKAKKLKMSGYSLSLKSYVLVESPLTDKSAPDRTWIKGNRKSMKVSWSKNAVKSSIDGYIVLRRAGKEKVYKQIAKVSKTTYSFTDKKAKKKNVDYSYTVVGYKKEGSAIRISPCAKWSKGVTSASKHKNGYKAKINKKSADLQVGGTVTLTIKYSKPKKIYGKKSFRWYTDNAKVAKVSKGKVTAVAPGTTTIRGITASGREYKCTVKVVGAFKPGKPKVELDYSTTSNIAIMWKKIKHATSYDVYCAEAGSDDYKLIDNVTGTSFNHEGLTKDRLYSYVVQARNDNKGFTEIGSKSAALDQKAVKTPRKTRVASFPSKKSVKARSHCSFKVKITAPDGRKATLQKYNGKKWVNTKKTFNLPDGIDTETVKITLPDSWWKDSKTKWRLSIPKSSGATAYKTGALTLTTKRYYQNPKKYVQIKNKISKHGLSYYTAPVLVNNSSTKKDHIEAMIKTAYRYLGDRYVVCQSRAPGKGVDCSGLVMQACYGAGVDLWPSNPYRHRSPAYEWESRNIAKHSNLKTVPYKNRKRGDLIFYANSNGVVIHVAIYLGNNKIIHSALSGVHVTGMGYAYGHVCKVKRIFN